jgi:hypothetical protein
MLGATGLKREQSVWLELGAFVGGWLLLADGLLFAAKL